MSNRCAWVTEDPMYKKYHDHEWGPLLHEGFPHSDTYLFEMLTLEGAQAGLSWLTILQRRQHYKEAFVSYDLKKIASFSDDDIERVLTSTQIIRNRLKVKSVVKNAQACLRVQEEYGSFGAYVWKFFGEKQQINHWKTEGEVPAWTEESKAWSKDLKKRGFSFVGPTICYAYMQAVGIVFDHTQNCMQYQNHTRQLT